jgi:hypothetical protein
MNETTKTNPMALGYRFYRAISVYSETAVRGNPAKQNYSVFPRSWHIDMDLRCRECGKVFRWTAKEQQKWFEEYHFWVDCTPRHCRECRAKRRHFSKVKREYDANIAAARNHGTLDQKRQIIQIISELEENKFAELPPKMIQTRELFQRQIRKLEA